MDYDDYYDDEYIPPRVPRLEQIYQILTALIKALPISAGTRSLSDGSGERLNGYIEELEVITSDHTIGDFKVQIRRQASNGTPFVRSEAYARQIQALALYLYSTNATVGYFCSPPDVKSDVAVAPAAMVNNHVQSQQTVSQSTTVHIDITQQIVTITEALTNFERDHPDELSKENQYAKALKRALPTVKSSLDIVALVLKIAGQVGIAPHIALKALGLG